MSMQNTATIIKRDIRIDIPKTIRLILLSFSFALLTGISSFIKFYLPFTPVPVTAQLFVVILSGLSLGPVFGGVSQAIYTVLGISGVKWFAVSNFGITAGYIIGFIFASALAGEIHRKYKKTALAVFSGILIIYLMGYVHFITFTGTAPGEAFKLTILPFIPFDFLKGAAIVAIFHKRLSKKLIK